MSDLCNPRLFIKVRKVGHGTQIMACDIAFSIIGLRKGDCYVMRRVAGGGNVGGGRGYGTTST